MSYRRKITLSVLNTGQDQNVIAPVMPEIRMIKKTVVLPKIKLLKAESNQNRINGLVTIGKVAKFLRNAKSNLKYNKVENLSQHQLNLIGDRTFFTNLDSESSTTQDLQKLGKKVFLHNIK